MEAAAATMAMDLHALSRRELQALCKRNGVRANMTNAAMAEALQSLTSVDGIDEIGTTLCLPTPGRSTMKSALKAAAAIGEEDEEQKQHGSPLPRGRRVSVMSPEAIRMDVEEGEDEMKRDLGKEIVRTPGVALRSTSRRARATPAPIAAQKMGEVAAPTPATLRRSLRTAAKKAPAPVEEVVTTAKRTTRRSARSKVMIDLDQEVDEVAVALQEVKVQEEDLKDVASDEKCDDPEEEEATKILEGGSKEEESEQGEEVSSAAPTILAMSDKSCDNPEEEEVVVVIANGEESAQTQEMEGAGKGQELILAEDSTPLPIMEDSPILGVLSKPEPVEPLSEKVEEASVGEWSAVKEIICEINCATDDKEVDADEVPEEKLPADVTGDKTSEVKEVSAVEMPQTDLTGNETSEEEGLDEVKEGTADEMLQVDLTDAETSEEADLDEESSEESDLDEVSSEEDDLDEESTDDETDGESEPSEVATDSDEEEVEMLQVTMKDDLSAEINKADDEEDDFSSDLLPEFDCAGNFSDAETESDTTVVDSSATKVTEASSEEEASQQKVESTLDTIVKSLDEFTFKVEDTQQELTEEMKNTDDAEAVGAKVLKKKKPTVEELEAKSLRKLKTMYKEAAKAAAEGKKLALAELDDNTTVDC
uniref:Uncharacterized protein n=1 Tax=Leersia perrieri TaxID=77586 RepID=A0A0D9VJU8_9ORYZ